MLLGSDKSLETIYDDDGVELHDGDKVRVNSIHVGTIRLLTDGSFEVHRWPEGDPIETLRLETRKA